jgi:hypothetical protein
MSATVHTGCSARRCRCRHRLFRDQDPPAATTEIGALSERPESREIRNLLDRAMLSFAAIKAGDVSVKGTTSALHESTLVAIRNLIDRALADAGPATEAPTVKKGQTP